MDDMEIVSAVRAVLAGKVGKERFDLWFGAQTRLTLRGDVLVIETPNQFSQDWLRRNFRNEIEAASSLACGASTRVEFRLDSSLADVPRAAKTSHAPAATQQSLLFDQAENAARPSSLAELPPVADVLKLPTVGRGEPAKRRFGTLAEFVVGHTNRLAHATAQMVAERPGCLSPLFIHGPTGTGKTLLLEGIWSAARHADQRRHVVYLSAEQFTTYFVEALRGTGLPNFRRKYRGVDVLIIDDLQFLSGKRATLVELLHTVDQLQREGRQMVFAADRPPAALDELGPELATRLAGGMVCKLDPPEYQTRLGIARHLAARQQLCVPDDVLQYMATHLTSHARELSGAINRLQATSAAARRPITLELAHEALSELVRHSGRAPKLDDIAKAVCHVFGLPQESLLSDRKSKTVSHPRMLAMWLARKHTRAAFSEIGNFFGRRSHSTVISAQKTVSGWMTRQASLSLANKTHSIEDVIRQVEQNLRAS